MTDITNKPDCPEDLATIALCVISELQAYIEGMRALSRESWGKRHADKLACLASRCADEWIEHFSGQVELIRKQDAEGGKS